MEDKVTMASGAYTQVQKAAKEVRDLDYSIEVNEKSIANAKATIDMQSSKLLIATNDVLHYRQ